MPSGQFSFTASHLLDALDGVAYLVSPKGTILAAGASWDRFAAQNGVAGMSALHVQGRDLFSMIAGEEVKTAYLRMHQFALNRQHATISFTFHCDAPEKERYMRMSISPLVRDGDVDAILYHSIILAEKDRVPLNLFSFDAKREHLDSPKVQLCSFCQRVASEFEGHGDEEQWISAEEYYAKGGRSDVKIEHRVCPDCVRTVILPHALPPASKWT